MNDSFTKRFALFIMMATASTSDLKINLDLRRGKLGSQKIKADSRKKSETQKIKPLDDIAGFFRFKIGESGALLHDDFTLNHSLLYDYNFIASKTKIVRNSVAELQATDPIQLTAGGYVKHVQVNMTNGTLIELSTRKLI